MSTATKQRRQFETRKAPNLVSMSPAPCRMIGVEVFKDDDGTHGVCWSHVIGFLCVVETIYSKPSESGKYSTGRSRPRGDARSLGGTRTTFRTTRFTRSSSKETAGL